MTFLYYGAISAPASKTAEKYWRYIMIIVCNKYNLHYYTFAVQKILILNRV